MIPFPIATATHSPGAVECPLAIVIPTICGLQHKLLISVGALYAYTGSVKIFAFLDDEEFEEPGTDAPTAGDVPPLVVRGELGPRALSEPDAGRVGVWVMSQRRS